MAKSSKNPDLLRQQAEQQLRQLTGWQNFNLMQRERGHTDAGTMVYSFAAIRPEAPNQPSAAIFLDADGHAVALQNIRSARPTAPATRPAVRRDPGAPITISPDTNFLTLNPGDTFDEVLTVNIPGQLACVADVYFLADATGSMGDGLFEIQTGINDIMTQLAGLGCDMSYGLGYYRDFVESGSVFPPSAVFVNLQGITANTGDVQTASAALSTYPGAGGDGPEGQLYALYQLAVNPGIGWRAGAKKIVVWFGDAPGHDPVCNSFTSLGFDLWENDVINQLTAAGIQVVAVSLNSGYALGLDDDPVATSSDYPCGPAGSAGQATRITNGNVLTGISPGSISAAIINLVSTAVGTISSISLVPAGGTAPFVSSISPSSYGPLNLGTPHSLPFDVSFLGVQPCTDVEQVFTGTIDVVADGAVVAQKTVEIRVPPCGCGCDPDSDACEQDQTAAIGELLAEAQERPFEMTSSQACAPASGSPCPKVELPADLHPCFSIKWGDGSRDQIETEDFEVLYLMVCNPFCNVAFGHLTIPYLEVTDASGNPVPGLPDGSPSVMLVPSRMVCFEEIPPCSCRVFELALKSCGALEGPYKIKFSYCIEEVRLLSAQRDTVEFDFEMVYS